VQFGGPEKSSGIVASYIPNELGKRTIMLRIFKLRSVALIATIALMGGTAFVASGATGAYFSDTNTGTITGSLGSIELDTSGGGGADLLDFTLNGLLPGVPRTVTVGFSNVGISPQDVYLVLDSAAVTTLNSFGGWATITVVRGDGTVIWDSSGPTPFSSPMLVRGNIAPGSAGSFAATLTISPGVTAPNLSPATVATVAYDMVATQVGIAPGA